MKVSETAFQLAERGFHVFPVRHDKTPYHPEGLKSASADPWFVEETFAKYGDKALIAIHAGRSGICVLDLDYKEDESGNVTVDGFEALELAWEEVPESFAYTSVSGQGRHIMYAAPEGKNLPPKAGYRGMKGVDRRSGESYVVFTADTLPDRASLAPAPEWLCDETSVRSADRFSGDVQAWYKTLEPGEPNALVRRAIEDVEALYAKQGDDLSHSDIIEAQHRAIRLAAEGNPGCEVLLDRIEELALSRTGEHSRSPEEYLYEFQEGLVSGIEKHGAAIELRSALPAYSLAVVPKSVPDRLVTGTNGTKQDFTDLLRALLAATDDDLLVTSILWNCPKTKDLAREWGMLFVHERVTSARLKPEPVRENPTIPVPEEPTEKKAEISVPSGTFLSAEETERVKNTETFIDRYRKATQAKGFTNLNYVPPVAWTCLSMAFGRKAFIPLAKPLEVNIWLTILGESTTGKGTEDAFFREVLNAMFLDGQSEHYNLGGMSSPDGLHLGLLQRDDKPSIIHNDEAADFFVNIRNPAHWMYPVPDKLSKWFDGFVEPSSKISLKDYRGKSARTSLNQLMWGTPDRVLEYLDASQFMSGYLARMNWVWDGTIPDPNRKSDLKIRKGVVHGTPQEVFETSCDLLDAASNLNGRKAVDGTDEAQARLNRAADDFRKFARKSQRWSFIKPAVDRLVMETLWKMAALTALYRGDTTFIEEDALVAIFYASDWLQTLVKVAESISESPYSRDLEEMEAFIRKSGGTVTRAALLHHFRGKVIRSQREIDDRIGYLVESGRVNRQSVSSGEVQYVINGG